MIFSLTRAILLLLAAVEEKAVNFFLENTKGSWGYCFALFSFSGWRNNEFKEVSMNLQQYRTAHILRWMLNDQNFIEEAF